ncbi:MAG TPA: NADH-quinone oxidoreductase subunit F, partial [Marinobacter adhaerens]|nr:NADH-quinone oxidoreductase subunit F [Marinobacter adhaerens]
MSGSTSGQGNPLRYHSRIRQSGTERQPETHPLTWRLRDDGEVVWLGEYLDKDGYQSVRRALAESDPQGIITVVKDANVRGRGGAGFSAGVKWSLTLQGGDMPRGYLICNADEMEPGTFKDRLLMEQQPHLLIEGMILGARANNARQGYIFLRGEYVEAARVL